MAAATSAAGAQGRRRCFTRRRKTHQLPSRQHDCKPPEMFGADTRHAATAGAAHAAASGREGRRREERFDTHSFIQLQGLPRVL